MRQHAKTKQRKMMFTLLKRWKIEKLSRRWANRRRQAEKKKKKNSTSSSLPLFPCMANTTGVTCVCWHRTKWIALDSGRGQRRTAHPKPFASAKCIVRRNLRGTLAHGCQKHASSLYYSTPLSPPPQQFMWLNYEWPRRHSNFQAHWALSLPGGHPKFIFKVSCTKCCRFWCAYYKFICVAD